MNTINYNHNTYEVKNVNSDYLSAKRPKTESRNGSHVKESSTVKYDLSTLFEKTPLFDIPPINYDEELEGAAPWTKLSHFILNGERGSMMNYVKTYQ